MAALLRAFCVLLFAVVAVASAKPEAHPLYVTVAKNGFVEFVLRGYSKAGQKRTAFLTSTPHLGDLYQLSQPYRKHRAMEAPYEASGRITTASKASPVEVGNKFNKLIFVAPKNVAEPHGEWTRFTYKVEAADGTVSYQGTVVVLPPSNLLVASSFSTSADNWVLRGGSATAEIVHEKSRMGAMNRFVHATEDEIDIRTGETSDSKQWKFCAPLKFLTNYEVAYGGALKYTLTSFSGNFQKLNSQRDLVTLQCSSCNQGQGMRFVQRGISFDGSQKQFSHSLHEQGGWVKDPKNVLKPWSAPSECEMVEMLSSISELCILGDHTVWYESVGLDNVEISAGPHGSINRECLCANPGTQCSS